MQVTDSLGCTGISNFVDVLVSSVPVATLPRESIRIYPQPASERVTIELALARAGSIRIELTDADGARALSLKREGRQGEQSFDVQIAGLAAGIYFIEIQTAEGRWVDRIIKR